MNFSHMMALMTLESASNMIDLISDEPNVLQLYEICPWWCILRQLMQAAIVILLELSFGSVHLPEEESKFVQLAKKCIRWFFAIPGPSARRAWRLCDSIFRKLAQSMKYTTDDIPSLSLARDQNPNVSVPGRSIDRSPEITRDYFNLRAEDMPLFGSLPVPEADLWTSLLGQSTPGLSSAQEPIASTDSYLPYDPLSDDFIRSFFAAPGEDSGEEF
jgi:hypothetical protein